MTDGWDQYLAEGEKVLWQGQPRTEISWARTNKRSLIIGTLILLYYGYALGFPRPNVHIVQTLFNGAMLIVGLAFVADAIGGRARRYARTWYTLTDRRVFIARDPLLGDRKLSAYGIGRSTQVKRSPVNPDHVWFSTRGKRPRMVPLRDLDRPDHVEAVLRGIISGES